MVCVLEQVNGLYSRITITIVCVETRSLAGVTHTQQHQMEAVHSFNSFTFFSSAAFGDEIQKHPSLPHRSI